MDYASLRLLLTQIEAVYEEEDWKRGETSSVQNPNDIEGAEGYENEIMFDGGAKGMGENDEEDMGALNITNLSGMLGTMWRKTQRVILGRKSYREHRRNRRRFRRQQQQQRRDNHYQQQQQLDENGDGGEIENYNSYWVITNSDSHPGGNHRRSQHTRDRNNKARKNNENKEANYRALDKGGWRSPGVTDYRDELFLESDDDVAFGYCEDDEEDDDDDWEDEGDWDGDYDEDEDQYYGYGDGYYNNYATLDDSESYDPIEEGKNPPLLDEGNHLPEHYHQGGVSNDHGNIGTKNEEFDCSSPGRDTSNHSSDYFGMSHGILESPTPTPNLQNVYNQEEHRYQKTKKTLSKASYETLLDASARKGDAPSGFNNGSSPSERSWGLLDFLPNLFAKKQTPKPRKSNSLERFLESEQDFLNAASNQSNRETDILSPHRDKKCRISDSPNHYTHFSESYHSSDEPPPPPLPAPSLFHADISSNRLKFRSEPNLSPLFERSETASISCPSEMSVMESSSISFRSSSAMNTGDEVGTAQLSYTNLDSSFNTPLAGKTFKKSHPVSATALGSAMPMVRKERLKKIFGFILSCTTAHSDFFYQLFSRLLHHQ